MIGFNEDVDKILNLSNNEDNVYYLLYKMIASKSQLAHLTKQMKCLKKLNDRILRHLGVS
jgi:hypothetical protein